MTETVTAPTADAGEATESSETAAKAPVSTKDKITKALGRQMPPLHEAFIKWVKAEADVDLDPTSVLATQSLYNVYRQTDEFKTLKESQPKATKVEPLPSTPEEAKAALEKHQKDQERRKAAEARANERAAKIQELLASMQGGESAGDEPADDADAPVDEDTQEAF